MTFWCKLLGLAAVLPGLAAAADPQMMNLVMPDATMVMEVNLAKIVASPIGLAMGESMHQGFSKQLNMELTKAKPQFQEQIAALANIDFSREVQDIVIAGAMKNQSPSLLILRCRLDLGRILALQAFTGDRTDYEGVPMLVSSKPGNGAIAFLDNSIVAIGQPSDVKAAIHRRSQHTALPPALAAQVAKYGTDDIWVATTGIPAPPLAGAAAPVPGGRESGAVPREAGRVQCRATAQPGF